MTKETKLSADVGNGLSSENLESLRVAAENNSKTSLVDIYKFGNVFEYRGNECIYILQDDRGDTSFDRYASLDRKIVSGSSVFRKEAKLIGLSFENFVGMANGDSFQVYSNIGVIFKEEGKAATDSYRKKEDETFSELFLRIAKERNYL